MSQQLDHTIVGMKDVAASLDFYTKILGLAPEGEQGPFKVLRVSPERAATPGPSTSATRATT